jgi:hypothetical protein
MGLSGCFKKQGWLEAVTDPEANLTALCQEPLGAGLISSEVIVGQILTASMQ